MDSFVITLITVAIMLAYAVPGWILVKVKMVKAEAIPAFATVLMYICQPGLTIYSFNKADFSLELLGNMGIFFGIITAAQILFLLAFFFLWRKKFDNVKYRIGTVATVMTNCGFFGVPLLEALFPQYTNAPAYAMMYFLSMSLIGWTLVSFIITGDKKHMSLKKMLINPATLSILVALPFFLTSTKLPTQIETMADVLGKMTTPVCMLVLGMRMATMKWKPLFTSPLQYLTVFINQVVFPLAIYVAVWFLPLPQELKSVLFISACCPVASVVLNYAEMLGSGQESAANTVLLGTMSSIITIPLLVLLL